MKQTAVEFLIKELSKQGLLITKDIDNLVVYNKAKELEKQQQGYSEEELKSAFKIGFDIGYGVPVQELDLKNEYCEKWFSKFKKK